MKRTFLFLSALVLGWTASYSLAVDGAHSPNAPQAPASTRTPVPSDAYWEYENCQHLSNGPDQVFPEGKGYSANVAFGRDDETPQLDLTLDERTRFTQFDPKTKKLATTVQVKPAYSKLALSFGSPKHFGPVLAWEKTVTAQQPRFVAGPKGKAVEKNFPVELKVSYLQLPGGHKVFALHQPPFASHQGYGTEQSKDPATIYPIQVFDNRGNFSKIDIQVSASQPPARTFVVQSQCKKDVRNAGGLGLEVSWLIHGFDEPVLNFAVPSVPSVAVPTGTYERKRSALNDPRQLQTYLNEVQRKADEIQSQIESVRSRNYQNDPLFQLRAALVDGLTYWPEKKSP